MSPRSASATGGWGSPDAAIDTPQRSPVMFTVCPKCALTLVVTAQDLRVAQGYVRCGRCSNVFNAIVGLTDDRGALANAGAPGTASTSIIRKAPSISDDAPATPQDALNDTGESEA